MNVDEQRLSRWRAVTPGCSEVTHLNNAGASLMPQPVFDAIAEHQRQELLHGSYEAAADAADGLQDLYEACAQLIGAEKPEEIAVLESATHAWAMAFYSIPFKAGDVVLTCSADYGANYVAALQLKQRIGIDIVEIEPNEHGEVCLEDLRVKLQHYTGRVKCVSITHIPTNGGLVNPCEEIGVMTKGAGVPFYLIDACQSVGQLPINVQALHCDFLSATSRKYLRGPRGLGFLYVRSSAIVDLEPITIDHFAASWRSRDEFVLRPDARRFEKWESSIANRIGLRAAIRYALSEVSIPLAWQRVQTLAAALREKLNTLRGPTGEALVSVHDQGRVKCGIVTFTVHCALSCAAIKARLRSQHRINVSVSTRAATLLDMERRGLLELLRASVHYYTAEAELDFLCDALVSIASHAQFTES